MAHSLTSVENNIFHWKLAEFAIPRYIDIDPILMHDFK